jgi:hypothetical protein
MSNRDLKLKLWQNDSRCYWCKRHTILTNEPNIKGEAPELMATIDHLVSRLHIDRWKKRDNSKVLACYACNARRAREEVDALSKEELIRRGKGFSLNPRGKPIISDALNTTEEVIDTMRKKLPDFDWYERTRQNCSSKPQSLQIDKAK